MKKLFATASYSFSNFYNNLNTQGQMVFSLIIILILLLCVILFIAYIIENVKSKLKLSKLKKNVYKYNLEKKETTKEDKKETNIEDISNAISDAMKEENPISLTDFEEDQEKTAIISIDELISKAKELELIDDEENTGVNYLEKYNLEPAEVNQVINEVEPKNKETEVKAFKVSQVISPIYGVKKEVVNDKEA